MNVKKYFIKQRWIAKSTAFLLLMTLPLSGCSKSASDGTVTSVEGGRKEIVVSVDSENDYLIRAAEKYMDIHKDVEITLNIIDTQNNRDKYTQAVSTEIMSGKGADIYDAMLLSYFKLADSGMLVDLNDYIGPDLKNEKYYSSLLDSLLYNGKRYTVPLSFNFTGYEIDKAVADEYQIRIPEGNLKLRDLLNFSELLPKDGSVMLFDGGGFGMNDLILTNQLIGQQFQEFVDISGKQASFENEEFYSIIEAVKKLTDNQQIYTQKAEENHEIDYSITKKSLIRQFLLYTPAMSNNGTMAYKDIILLANDEGNTTFSSASFLPVVSQNSENKEIAADFILFLLSDEMQSMPELLFCPVNKEAVREVSLLVYEDSKAGGWLPENFTKDTLDMNIDIFAKLADSLDSYENQERFVNSLINNEMTLLYQGSETAEQAAANLQASIQSYLNE